MSLLVIAGRKLLVFAIRSMLNDKNKKMVESSYDLLVLACFLF